MITMLDIAKRSGISRYTVSKVLNGNPSVRPATREKVLAACRKYGYIPDSAAVGLVKGHTNLIGVTVPYLTDDFYSEFIEKLDRIAPVRGYQLIYRSSYNDGATEAAILRSFLSLKVCGLIVVPVVRGADPAIHRLAARRVPVVYFDRAAGRRTVLCPQRQPRRDVPHDETAAGEGEAPPPIWAASTVNRTSPRSVANRDTARR